MQILDRIPAAPAAGNDPSVPPEHHDGQSLPDEFSRMMQQALATKPKKVPNETAPRTEKTKAALPANPAAAEAVPAIFTAKKNAGKDSMVKPAAKTETTAATTSADSLTTYSAAPMLPVPNLPPVLPVLMAGPLAAPEFPAATSSPLSTPGKNSSAATVVTVVPAVGVVSTTENLKPGLAKDLVTEANTAIAAELTSVKPATGSASPKLEPVKSPADMDINALFKNAGSAAAENSSGPESPASPASAEPALNSELTNKTIEAAAAAQEPAATNDGTGVAIVDLPMKNTQKANKVAGLAGKVLPGDAALPATAKVLPNSALGAPVRATDNSSTDSNFIQPMPAAVATVDFSTAPAAAVPAFMEARLRNLERTHDMVALHAVRLVESQTDTLSVVIKPGAGTELSLQLRQRDGGVEAHAVLQRGDFQLMNQHWPELQQRLEQRGIKLAPLGSETNFSTDNGSSFKQHQQASQEAEAQKASAFAEFALAGRALGATARLAVGVSGWESWA